MIKLEIKLLRTLQQAAAYIATEYGDVFSYAYIEADAAAAAYAYACADAASEEFKSIYQAYDKADTYKAGVEIIKQRLEKYND